MIKQVLCSLWGHVWKAVLATNNGGRKVFIAERCERCQV